MGLDEKLWVAKFLENWLSESLERWVMMLERYAG